MDKIEIMKEMEMYNNSIDVLEQEVERNKGNNNKYLIRMISLLNKSEVDMYDNFVKNIISFRKDRLQLYKNMLEISDSSCKDIDDDIMASIHISIPNYNNFYGSEKYPRFWNSKKI